MTQGARSRWRADYLDTVTVDLSLRGAIDGQSELLLLLCYFAICCCATVDYCY